MKTVKLYEQNAYQKEFYAKIIDIIDCKIVLDQTLFFPEGGGQFCDQGTISGLPVIDVQIEEGIIYHTVKDHSLHLGETIKGIIDFDIRFSNMQNHSSEHILSGLVKRLFGFDNIGFHLGREDMTADFNGFFSREDILMLENKVNEVIFQNKKIRAFYPEDPSLLDYRSKKELNEPVRLVEIEDIDLCACCAPHVLRTGEIGQFKILKTMNMKKGTRFFIAGGKRALESAQKDYQLLVKLYHLLSANDQTLLSYVQGLLNTNKELSEKYHSLQREMLFEGLKRNSCLFIDELAPHLQRELVDEHYNITHSLTAIFVGNDHRGYRFIIKGNDLSELLSLLKEKGAKGGGSKLMVQGFLDISENELKEALSSFF